jgi:mycoredoxin
MATLAFSPYAAQPAPIRLSVPVTIYGRRWCALSQMLRRQLDRLGIDYEYVDLDANPAAEQRLAWLLGGRVPSPIVNVDGQLLAQPSMGELRWALSRVGAL